MLRGAHAHRMPKMSLFRAVFCAPKRTPMHTKAESHAAQSMAFCL